MIAQHTIIHAIKMIDNQPHAGIFGQEIAMPEEKPPVQAIPDSAPGALLVVAHAQDVAGGADVGFGGDPAPIGVLAHAVDVGHHDPIIGIDEHLHEPAVDLIRVKFA